MISTIEIRTMNPYGFRSEEWANLLAEMNHPKLNNPCYLVEFSDGVRDYWPVLDATAGYEFRQKDLVS